MEAKFCLDLLLCASGLFWPKYWAVHLTSVASGRESSIEAIEHLINVIDWESTLFNSVCNSICTLKFWTVFYYFSQFSFSSFFCLVIIPQQVMKY